MSIKPFLYIFGRWLLKLRYTPLNVFLRNNDVCNSFPTLDIEMSRNDILLSCSIFYYLFLFKCCDGTLDNIFQSHLFSGLFWKCWEGSNISFGFPYSPFLIAYLFLFSYPDDVKFNKTEHIFERYCFALKCFRW